MSSVLGPGYSPPYSGSPAGAPGCPLWWRAPVLPASPPAFWFGGPGPLQGGPVWWRQLLGGRVEGRGMGRHRCNLPRYRTQRRWKTLPAGAQRELLAAEVYTRWICRLAWQPQDHGGCATLPQNRRVPGTPERSVVLLQCVGHSGAPAHLSLPVLPATVPGVPPGPGLYPAYLPPWGRQWKPHLTSPPLLIQDPSFQYCRKGLFTLLMNMKTRREGGCWCRGNNILPEIRLSFQCEWIQMEYLNSASIRVNSVEWASLDPG